MNYAPNHYTVLANRSLVTERSRILCLQLSIKIQVEGIIYVDGIVRGLVHIDNCVPSVIDINPEVGCVAHLEEDLKNGGMEYKV
ncbi:hypothetical protein J6590_015199 [Homalodisca vitripennis]|nr:hypothetical protein J6590_015199 [Homalodisca vitripennis]